MATVSGTTGAPTNTQFSGDEIYEFSVDGSITFSVGGLVEHLILPAGASGGSGGLSGGGGGAGAHVRGSFIATPSTYSIAVGTGGLPVNSGQGNDGGVSGITGGGNAPGSFSGGGGGGGEVAGSASTDGSGGGGGSGGGLAGGSEW